MPVGTDLDVQLRQRFLRRPADYIPLRSYFDPCQGHVKPEGFTSTVQSNGELNEGPQYYWSEIILQHGQFLLYGTSPLDCLRYVTMDQPGSKER
jgi:hypothetical protein